MKTFYNLLVFFSCFLLSAVAQNVGMGSSSFTPNSSSMLEVKATDKGVLLPRVSLSSITDVATISSPANGLVVFNTNESMTNGSGPGFYFYCSVGCSSTGWKFMTYSANGAGTSGQVLTSGGSGVAPSWASGGGSSSDCLPAEMTGEFLVTGLPCGTANCGANVTMANCLTFCDTTTYNGSDDWRIPTLQEFIYLIPTVGIATTTTGYAWTTTDIMTSFNQINAAIARTDLTLLYSIPTGISKCRCVR